MDDLSPSLNPKTANQPATSSQASEDGPTPSSWLAGIQLEMFGQGPARANHSQSQEKGQEPATIDTSGLSGESLSPSAVLQLSLESRLRASLDVNGSLESELIWKHWAMPLGPQICALRVSTHRTAAKDFTGWPTPDTVAIGDQTDFETQRLALLARRERTKEAVKAGKTLAGSGRSMTLQMAAKSIIQLTGQITDLWPTPLADGDRTTNYKQGGTSLGYAARSISEISGMTTTSPNAEPSTAQSSTGALNPDFCRWLMGYPADYAQGLSEDTGTR